VDAGGALPEARSVSPAIAMPLPVVELPASGEERFRCVHYACVLTAATCVQRQTTVLEWRGASRHTGAFTKRYVPGHLQFCASGKCEQGKAVLAAIQPLVEEVPAA
jgi:hypothetical protein